MKLDKENKLLLGVCSGMAKHFDIDVTLVRVGFIAGCWLGGLPILLYPILWLIMEASNKEE